MTDVEARTDWQDRVGRRSAGPSVPAVAPLPPPQRLSATAGRGQVTLDWAPVDAAVGYLVHTSPGPEGPWVPLDHHGGDVLAVPHGPYADTTGQPGAPTWYAVATLADPDVVGPLSEPVAAACHSDGPAQVAVTVDAASAATPLPRPWRPMIGSEHLSFLLSDQRIGGQEISSDLRAALGMVRDAWGVQSVRAHAILGDDLGVYREVDGLPVHDFSGIDRVYDQLLALDLRPVVELSFMPAALASDPGATVFDYAANVSPPKDWQRWADLVTGLVSHLVDRYGRAELCEHWAFEVWNEANLEVFWSGTPQEYLRLYDVTAAAVKEVDPGLRVGGPASAAVGWVDLLLDHVHLSGAACDFVSTHTYGSPPLDLRPVLERHGRPGTPQWWTEWGDTPTHFNTGTDGVLSAAFLLRGMRSAMGRVEALSYWVASDHFEELGRPDRLFHGGFGLVTVGGLRKPRFNALSLLDRLGDHQLDVRTSGDGAGSLVEAVAARDDDGRVAVCAWNGTLDQTRAGGDARLDRHVHLEVTGLPAPRYVLRHRRVDATHGDVAAQWRRIGRGRPWPAGAEWDELRRFDSPGELATRQVLVPQRRRVVVETDLPMPAISLIELTPARD